MLDELLVYLDTAVIIPITSVRVGYMEPETENIYGFFLIGSPALRHHMSNTKVFETSLQVTIRGNENDKATRDLGRVLINSLKGISQLSLPNHTIIDIVNDSDLQFIGRTENLKCVYTTSFTIVNEIK